MVSYGVAGYCHVDGNLSWDRDAGELMVKQAGLH